LLKTNSVSLWFRYARLPTNAFVKY